MAEQAASTSRYRVLAAATTMLLIGTVVAATLHAGASTRHDDVPEGSWADRQVEKVAEAGIATGYRDGSFQPQAPISRAEAAAWINRSGVEVDASYGNVTMSASAPDDTTVTQLDVSSPAAGFGGGFVRIDGQVGAATFAPTGVGCPCAMTVKLVADGEPLIKTRVTVPGTAMADEQTQHGPTATVFLPFVIPLEAGGERHIELVAELTDSDVGDMIVAGALTTTYTPFNGNDGANNWPSNPPAAASAGGPVVLLP